MSCLIIAALIFVVQSSPAPFTASPAYKTQSSGDSCLSRSEHNYMRKPSQMLSVPAPLSRALARYEKMHAGCYLNKDMKLSVWNLDKTNSCKYLVHHELDGLGNRLLGLTSAFVFSVLTNRVFLVDPRGQCAKLLCEPFQNSSWQLPSDFLFSFLDQAPSLETSVHSDKYGAAVHVWMTSLRRDQEFFDPQVRFKLKNITWMCITSNLYFVPRLFSIPEFWKPLMSLFPDARMAFTYLSRYLLLPQDHVWEKIVRFDSAYLSGPGKRLGVQIRLHHRDDPGLFDKLSFNRVLECLIGNHFLPMVINSSISTQQNGITRRVNVLIASLQSRYFREMKEMFLKFPTVDGSLIQVHTFSHEGVQTESMQQAVKALAEMWLLGFSDILVTSSSSTFGYIAQGIAGIRPYVLHIRPEEFKNCSLPACSRRVSPAPCNHQPYFDEKENSGRSMEHLAWMNRHIRRCQDNWHGAQLL